MPDLDVARLRQDTPGCERVIHFNNAGAGLMPRVVLDTVTAHLTREAHIGAYEAADEARDRLAGLYASAARLVGGHPDEIALVDSATRAWDTVVTGIDWRPGDRVLVAQAEYGSNVIALLHLAERAGIEIAVVPDDAHGQLDVGALEALLDDRVRLVALTHVPTNGGLVNPVEAVGALTRARGVPFLLDACQSVGQMPIDVGAIGCDMLSATGRKYLRGPRGTGFLWVRRPWLTRLRPAVLDARAADWVGRDRIEVRADGRRFELWENNVAARLGLAAAIDYALATGLEPLYARIQALAEALREALRAIPGVAVHDRGQRQCGIVSFSHTHASPYEIRSCLRAASVNISVSERDMTRFDMEARGLSALARASVHGYNTLDEIAAFTVALRALSRD